MHNHSQIELISLRLALRLGFAWTSTLLLVVNRNGKRIRRVVVDLKSAANEYYVFAWTLL
jgi:hypothetical protein